jgi:hypothetical protein
MSQQKRRSPTRGGRISRSRKPKRTQASDAIPSDLLRCSEELIGPVFELHKRYRPETVYLAMLSQSAAGFRTLREERLCTREQALRACKEFEDYVLQEPVRRTNNASRS